jgi:hypothetical protein
MKIYRDTNTLLGNIRDETELAAVTELERLGLTMFGSHIGRSEAMNTKDENKRRQLVNQHDRLERTPKDEKLLGFNVTTDHLGGFVCSPMISDVQDEQVRAELMQRGLEQRDAEHIAQAVANDFDIFLTCDKNTIINPHRKWLEQRFPKLKIRLPSKLLAFIQAGERTD